MNTALAELYALQQVDIALADAQRRYSALDPGRAEQAAFEQAQVEHAARSQAFHSCSADLHDAELELKSVEGKKKDLEGKLYGGRVQAFKELETIDPSPRSIPSTRGTPPPASRTISR